MNIIEKIFGIDKLELKVAGLLETVKTQDAIIKKYEQYENYVSIPVPKADAVNRFLSDLAKQQMFLFYLMTIENEIMLLFRNGKDSELYRGGLRVIDKIREHLKEASYSESNKNAKV